MGETLTHLKRTLLVSAVILLTACGYLAGAHFSGGAWFTFGLPLGGDRGELRRTTTSFIEDIQFKDFDSAATYHDPAVQEEVDIPMLLERLFLQKPEMIDIAGYEILYVDVDTSDLRARLRCQVELIDLATSTERKQQFMLFYKRESLESPWYMDLESSLDVPGEGTLRGLLPVLGQ